MTHDSLATKVATGVSVASATTAWIAHTQAILGLIASAVAIVAGLFAISNYIRHGGTLNPVEIWKQRKRKRQK